MQGYFSIISQGALAILLTAAIASLFSLAFGWLTVWSIGAFRAMAIHLKMAAQEPKEAIIKRYKNRGKILQFRETAERGR